MSRGHHFRSKGKRKEARGNSVERETVRTVYTEKGVNAIVTGQLTYIKKEAMEETGKRRDNPNQIY